MPHEFKDTDDPWEWMKYARSDLEFARMPLPPGALYEQLCFHLQQAAEKSIKAVLIHLRIVFPYTHNIQVLVDILPENIPRTSLLVNATRLSHYAALARYPGEEESVDEQEYRDAMAIAEQVVKWAEEFLSAEEK